MQLDPEAFNSWLADIGQQTTWRRSYACPCVNPNSKAPAPNCPQCFGKGHVWADPVPSVVGMAGQKTQDRWAQSSRYQEGDIVVTIPSDVPMYGMGQFDRVLMLNSSDRFSQPYQRGAPSERMSFQPQSIERVYWLDPATKTPVEGVHPVVSATGVLTWPSTGGPPAGVYYSISGLRRSEYFCFNELPSNRNMHSGAALPRKVILRRWDLFGR